MLASLELMKNLNTLFYNLFYHQFTNNAYTKGMRGIVLSQFGQAVVQACHERYHNLFIFTFGLVCVLIFKSFFIK